jgi:hypothetical protein
MIHGDEINQIKSKREEYNNKDIYRGINEFTNYYGPRTNLTKVEGCDLLSDSNKILDRRITSLSNSMYMELMLLGKLKCTKLGH